MQLKTWVISVAGGAQLKVAELPAAATPALYCMII